MHVVVLFGTRPEVIKMAPVVRALDARGVRTTTVGTGQHADLIRPFARDLGIRVDADLDVGRPGQTILQITSRVLSSLEPLLVADRPGAVLVQGDTNSAYAGAFAAYALGVPVGHVEAGLRSGQRDSPFPEEMNRRLITQLADRHFAATARNVRTLLDEGVRNDAIIQTGNPVVDAILWAVEQDGTSMLTLPDVGDARLLVLTTHRRESFGPVMQARMHVLREFVDAQPDTALMFPVHPNPAVRAAADELLGGHPRIHLIPPLDYFDFAHLLARAWLVVSDSGGVQEEAPSLGKPVLVIRDCTERPEAIEAGVARLVTTPEALAATLNEIERDDTWARSVARIKNPFGDGHAGEHIADAVVDWIGPNAATLRRAQ